LLFFLFVQLVTLKMLLFFFFNFGQQALRWAGNSPNPSYLGGWDSGCQCHEVIKLGKGLGRPNWALSREFCTTTRREEKVRTKHFVKKELFIFLSEKKKQKTPSASPPLLSLFWWKKRRGQKYCCVVCRSVFAVLEKMKKKKKKEGPKSPRNAINIKFVFFNECSPWNA